MTTIATRRAPASLSATEADCALPPDTQVSSTTSTSAPATARRRGASPGQRRAGEPPPRARPTGPRAERQRTTGRGSPADDRRGGRGRSARRPRSPAPPPSRPRSTATPRDREVGGQHQPQPGRRFGRARVIRLVPPQVLGKRTAPDRVADRRHRVREQFPGLAPGQVALIAPGEPDWRRPPAGPAGHASDATNRHRQSAATPTAHARRWIVGYIPVCSTIHYLGFRSEQPLRRQGRGVPFQPLRASVAATMAALSHASSVTSTGPNRRSPRRPGRG